MKRYVKSATNSVNIPPRVETITADSEDEVTLDDKINDAKDDFNYILDGISQLDLIEGNEVVNRLNATLQEYIQDIAGKIQE